MGTSRSTRTPGAWLADGDIPNVELRVDALDNIWLVEMGRRQTAGRQSDWHDFGTFVAAVASSPVRCEGLSVQYRPIAGRDSVWLAWPLTVGGQEIPLRSALRYDNPYCHCAFPFPVEEGVQRSLSIRRGDEILRLVSLLPHPEANAMSAAKVTIIGAGSVVFSLGLAKDLCLTEGLQGSTVSFVGHQ